MRHPVADTTKRVIDLLVAGEYTEIEKITRRVRLSADEIAQGVKEYGGTLIPLPEEQYDSLDVVQVTGATTPTWSVRVDLWTKEEGRSDLSAELTVVETADGFRVELDDIHVL